MPAPWLWLPVAVGMATLAVGLTLAWVAGIYLLAHGADDATTFLEE